MVSIRAKMEAPGNGVCLTSTFSEERINHAFGEKVIMGVKMDWKVNTCKRRILEERVEVQE